MTVTPWGRAAELRARQLKPGPGKSRAGVARNQRERLLGAMVSVAAEKGYAATSVADLLAVAGVSRNAFYKLFANKHDCFLATIDAIGELAGPTVLDLYDATPGPWDRRLGAMLDALAATIVAQPAAARIAWVEVHAAGAEAVERVERIDRRVEQLVERALRESPEHRNPPPGCIRAMVGGLRKVVHTRVREGREGELPALMPQLLDWIRSYRTPAEPLGEPREIPPALTPDPPAPADSRERVMLAFTELLAERGYPRTPIADIAARAGVSLSTFYAHFPSKREAFVATIEQGRRRILGLAAPAFAAGGDWPRSVSSGLHGLLALFATETATARAGTIAAYEGGGEGLELRDAAIVVGQGFLREGYRLHPDTPPAAAEGIGASIYALLAHETRGGRVDRLYERAPLAAFIALAPFLGADAAARVANEPPAAAAARGA